MDSLCVAPGTLREGDLLAYLDGEAPPEVGDHIARCPACALELAELARGEPAPTRRPPPGGQVRRIGAALLQAAQLASGQPAPALRGAGQSAHYQVGPYLVIVALIPPPLPEAGWQLEGQVSRTDELETPVAGGEALLLRGESVLLRDQIDETGFFTLDPLRPGVYLLELALPDARISIADLTVV